MGKKNVQKGKFDEVEYSEELADAEDKEAMARMEASDNRATKKQKKNK
ncbi:YfhD family protein [Halalkalibacter alkalisediminis]|uniref:YfhD family protein n=1 Tax=Halalkalibacter alkalisediminis TaxID=935616 RepID=A0ABV6NNY2_9BACI|nr:YfhD family protein [Halalkalibacter alkalisediminis]